MKKIKETVKGLIRPKLTDFKVGDRVRVEGVKIRIPGTIITAPKKDDVGVVIKVIPGGGLIVKQYIVEFETFGRAKIAGDDLGLRLVQGHQRIKPTLIRRRMPPITPKTPRLR